MGWLDELLNRFVELVRGRDYWVCGHRWCYLPSTYQYRCHLHQWDP